MHHDHDDRHDRSLEARARRRVRLKLGFYIHLLVFVLVNLGLWGLRQLGLGPWHHHGWDGGGPGPWGGWPFPLWGWALGLAIHGIVTGLKLQGDGFKQRLLDREIETLKRREGP